MNELGENIHRPAHIDVKTWIPENPGNPTLVTQLYLKETHIWMGW